MRPRPEVRGHCGTDCLAVADAFRLRAEQAAEAGASPGAAVSVWHDGALVVDLWTGAADPGTGRPWDERTLVCMMSVAKGVSALCVNILAERGLIDLDAPVARYWPAFAAHGKDGILVRHVLDHTAGLPFVSAPVDAAGALAWEPMIRALEAEPPLTVPGEQPAYHSVTMGYLLGEVVRRVCGVSIGTFFRREIGEPLGLDYWIGLPPGQHARCATIGGDLAGTIFGMTRRDPESLFGRAMRQVPYEILNDAAFRSAELPSINGHGRTASIATLYGLLASGGGGLLSRAALDRAISLQWSGVERTMGHHRNMAMGFILAGDNLPMGSGRSFGHTGAGGSIGFGDMDRGLGVCFSTNHLHAGPGLNPWMVGVCASVFRAKRFA